MDTKLATFADALEKTLLTIATGKKPDGGYITDDGDVVKVIAEGTAKMRNAIEESDPLSPELRDMVTKAVAKVTAAPVSASGDRSEITKAMERRVEQERKPNESLLAAWDRLAATDPVLNRLYAEHEAAPLPEPPVEKTGAPDLTRAEVAIAKAAERIVHPGGNLDDVDWQARRRGRGTKGKRRGITPEQAYAKALERAPQMYSDYLQQKDGR
jgi:hypothetical protein